MCMHESISLPARRRLFNVIRPLLFLSSSFLLPALPPSPARSRLQPKHRMFMVICQVASHGQSDELDCMPSEKYIGRRKCLVNAKVKTSRNKATIIYVLIYFSVSACVSACMCACNVCLHACMNVCMQACACVCI